jgi:hypothetical protein
VCCDLAVRFAPTLESRRVVADGPDDGSIIECFGQSFRWDPASGHQTIDELEPLRLLGDGPMCASPGVLLCHAPGVPHRSSASDPYPIPLQGRRDRGGRAVSG